MICQQDLTGLGFLPAMFFIGFIVSWVLEAREAGKVCLTIAATLCCVLAAFGGAI